MAHQPGQGDPSGLRPLCVLGLGAVGRALGEELALAGYPIRGWSPRLELPLSEAGPANPPLAPNFHFEAKIDAALAEAQAVLICVRDAAIAELAERLDGLLVSDARPIVLHTSGFHGPDRLERLTRRGFPTGVLHPLTAVPRGAQRRPGFGLGETRFLRGVWFATNGADPARAFARELIVALGGRELPLADNKDSQALYHAGAALLSNGMVALFDAALAVARHASSDERALHSAFATLLAATSDNLQRASPAQALTGPIARGDVEVVRGHLDCLQRVSDRASLDLYRQLGRRLVALAGEAGRLDNERLDELEGLLDD